MFLAAVEEATSVMKNVLDTPEPVSPEMYLCSNVQLRNLADMIAEIRRLNTRYYLHPCVI